jgi:putative membrane protein insertion efficiency factor
MIRAALLFLIRLYQMTLSRLIGPSCRFEPSCSRYTATCIERFGALRGSWLGIKRVGRCHPLNPGGYDPPPQSEHHHRHEAHHG